MLAQAPGLRVVVAGTEQQTGAFGRQCLQLLEKGGGFGRNAVEELVPCRCSGCVGCGADGGWVGVWVGGGVKLSKNR